MLYYSHIEEDGECLFTFVNCHPARVYLHYTIDKHVSLYRLVQW